MQRHHSLLTWLHGTDQSISGRFIDCRDTYTFDMLAWLLLNECYVPLGRVCPLKAPRSTAAAQAAGLRHRGGRWCSLERKGWDRQVAMILK